MKILNAIEKFLRKWVMESFLSRTAPETRFIVAVMLVMSIFIDDYIALGIYTSITAVIIASSFETLLDNWIVAVAPLFMGIVFGFLAVFWPDSLTLMGVSPAMTVWKFFVLTLSAVVFLILLPQRDLQILIRRVPYPTVWAALMAAFRGVEIGGWALAVVRKTTKSKRIVFFWHPIVWVDAFATGMAGHFFEFLNSFQISLRNRGVESPVFSPKETVPVFSSLDIFVLLAVFAGYAGLVRW